jgi:hypothetical protein
MAIKKINKDISSYQKRRVFTTKRFGHAGRPCNWWILIEQARHEPEHLFLSQSYIT